MHTSTISGKVDPHAEHILPQKINLYEPWLPHHSTWHGCKLIAHFFKSTSYHCVWSLLHIFSKKISHVNNHGHSDNGDKSHKEQEFTEQIKITLAVVKNQSYLNLWLLVIKPLAVSCTIKLYNMPLFKHLSCCRKRSNFATHSVHF